MPFVKCPKHGRVYDNAKEEGCPLCVQEAAMPRAPGSQAAQPPRPEEAAARGKLVLLLILAAVLAVAGGVYWYGSTHTPEDAAQHARDSLRALGAGPPRADTTLFTDANDLTPIRRARALKANLEELLRANRATIVGMTEGPIDTAVTDRAAKRRALQQLAFVNRWHTRIDALTKDGADFRYAPGIRMGPQMESVTNYLGAALSVMRDMVPRTHVKARAERQNDAVSAGGYLNSAGTVLTNLPR